MGTFTDLFFGTTPPTPTPDRVDLHTSTLASIILATQLQNGGGYSQALSVAAVYRGQQILADKQASFPWHVYEGGQHSGSRSDVMPVRLDELPGVLVQPDPMVGRDQWLRDVVTALVMRGNAYLLGEMYVEGHPTMVRALNPDQVTVEWADEARTHRVYSWGVDTPLPTSRVRHLTLNLQPGALKGLGPIDAIAATITGQIAADAWSRDLFISSGTPSGKLMVPGKLDFDEAQRLAEQWDLAHQGTRQTAILSGGMDFEAISLTPDQAQFLQSRSFGVSEIARALGIPAHLLNAATGVAGASGSSLTYTNVRDIYFELLSLTLQPVYGDRITAAMSSYLPRGKSVQFDYTEFMRADEATRYQAASVALGAGFLTVDEIRAKEGLAPSPELAAEKVRKADVAAQISGGGDSGTTEPQSADTDN